MNPDDPNTHSKIVKINVAYGVLSDEIKRKDYDVKLGLYERPLHDVYDSRASPGQRQAPTFTGYSRFRTKPYAHRQPWRNPYRSTEEMHRRYQEAMRSDSVYKFRHL